MHRLRMKYGKPRSRGKTQRFDSDSFELLRSHQLDESARRIARVSGAARHFQPQLGKRGVGVYARQNSRQLMVVSVIERSSFMELRRFRESRAVRS